MYWRLLKFNLDLLINCSTLSQNSLWEISGKLFEGLHALTYL